MAGSAERTGLSMWRGIWIDILTPLLSASLSFLYFTTYLQRFLYDWFWMRWFFTCLITWLFSNHIISSLIAAKIRYLTLLNTIFTPLLERNVLKQIVSRLNINVHYDLLVVGLSKLLGHPRHLSLHVLLQHNRVHRILRGSQSVR